MDQTQVSVTGPDDAGPADYLASPGRAQASLFAVIAPAASQAGSVSATEDSQHIRQRDLDSLFPARESLSDSAELNSLFSSQATFNAIDQAALWAGWGFKKDPDDLRQTIALELCRHASLVSHLTGPGLKNWCFRFTRQCCLDEIRHENVQEVFSERTGNEAIGFRRGGKPGRRSGDVPEDSDILIKEIYRDLAGRYPKWLVEDWLSGKAPKEISDDHAMSVQTVYRLLKGMQKYIIEEYGPRM